jgi:Uma2 family endonuclease
LVFGSEFNSRRLHQKFKIKDFRFKIASLERFETMGTMGTTTHLMNAEELVRLPDDGLRHELIKGEHLTLPPPSPEHGAIMTNVAFLLHQHVRAWQWGKIITGDAGFKLESDPDTVLGPAVAFIRLERIAGISTHYFPGAPDLVVEILSPGDRRGKIEAKASMWLEAGAAAVWLINPKARTVDVCRAAGEKKLLTVEDELTGDDIISGFRCRVAEIFD